MCLYEALTPKPDSIISTIYITVKLFYSDVISNVKPRYYKE